jgi:acetyltransferase-like isoleucine patch superfamily enzyme
MNDYLFRLYGSSLIARKLFSRLLTVYIGKGCSGHGLKCLQLNNNVHLDRNCIFFISDSFVSIGSQSYLGANCNIRAVDAGITIGDNVIIGPNVVIVSSDHRHVVSNTPFATQGNISEEVKIGNNIWVGAGCIITRGSLIQDDVVIAANSVTKGLLESGWLYGGAPARKLKRLEVL